MSPARERVADSGHQQHLHRHGHRHTQRLAARAQGLTVDVVDHALREMQQVGTAGRVVERTQKGLVLLGQALARRANAPDDRAQRSELLGRRTHPTLGGTQHGDGQRRRLRRAVLVRGIDEEAQGLLERLQSDQVGERGERGGIAAAQGDGGGPHAHLLPARRHRGRLQRRLGGELVQRLIAGLLRQPALGVGAQAGRERAPRQRLQALGTGQGEWRFRPSPAGGGYPVPGAHRVARHDCRAAAEINFIEVTGASVHQHRTPNLSAVPMSWRFMTSSGGPITRRLCFAGGA